MKYEEPHTPHIYSRIMLLSAKCVVMGEVSLSPHKAGGKGMYPNGAKGRGKVEVPVGNNGKAVCVNG